MKIKSDNLITLSTFLLIFLIQGCATLNIHHYERTAQRPAYIMDFYESLDDVVESELVRDASHLRIRGFPNFRTNRFLVALKEHINDDQKREAWIELLRQLDIESREKEIRNLSEASVQHLAGKFNIVPDRAHLIHRVKEYSRILAKHDRTNDQFFETLKQSVKDPGEYSVFLRVVGLYPLFAIPMQIGAKVSYKEILEWHQSDVENLKISGVIVIYVPPPTSSMSHGEINQIFNQAQHNEFGFPVFNEQQLNNLIQSFAPILSQDQVGSYDKPGTVIWKDNKVTIDTEKPAVYTYVSHSFIDEEPVLQLNYVFWYEGRLGPNAPWIERGRLDGVTLRITLNQNGDPLLTDIMNNCGCYFMFIPRKESIKKVITKQSGIGLLTPSWLPDHFPKDRLWIRVNSGWHQVQKVFTDKTPEAAQSYTLLSYDILEVLPHDDGRMESVFNHHGIMKNSSRIEPLFFFPSGIPKVGYMRQRGNHPIKLIGRSYFTDPYLYNQNFKFNLIR